MFVSLTRVCILLVVKELRHSGGAWSINGHGV